MHVIRHDYEAEQRQALAIEVVKSVGYDGGTFRSPQNARPMPVIQPSLHGTRESLVILRSVA